MAGTTTANDTSKKPNPRPRPDNRLGLFKNAWARQSVSLHKLHPPIAAPLGDVITPRLSLGRVGRSDLDELAAIFAQSEVWQFPEQRGLTRAETAAFIERQIKVWDDCGFGGCAARRRSDGSLIGILGLSVPTDVRELLPAVSVGWRIAPTAWGDGYATEGAGALLEEAFVTMRVPRVFCVTQPENTRSVRLAARLGMTRMKEVDVPREDQLGFVNVVIYEIDAAARRWSPSPRDARP